MVIKPAAASPFAVATEPHAQAHSRAAENQAASAAQPAAQKGETIFARCADAYAAGYKNIPRGQPGYAPHLDRDNDGIACERR